eukprot:XP_001702989.1 predicted protein [Chlamydomonas reinhardtii]
MPDTTNLNQTCLGTYVRLEPCQTTSGGACKAFTGYAFQQGKDVTNNLLGTAVTGSLETAAAVCSSNCACQSFTSTQLIKSDAVVVTGGGTGTCDGTFVRTINCTAATLTCPTSTYFSKGYNFYAQQDGTGADLYSGQPLLRGGIADFMDHCDLTCACTAVSTWGAIKATNTRGASGNFSTQCQGVYTRTGSMVASVAGSKPVSASSEDTGGGYQKSYLVDNNIGNVFSTASGGTTTPWVAIDLQADYTVTNVQLYNDGTYGNRLGWAEVRVGMTRIDDSGDGALVSQNALCYKFTGRGTNGAVYSYFCTGGAPDNTAPRISLFGRYVTIQNFNTDPGNDADYYRLMLKEVMVDIACVMPQLGSPSASYNNYDVYVDWSVDGAALTAPTYPVFSWKACADYCRTTTGCLGFKYRATSRQCDLFSTRGKLERVWDPADTATFGATGYGDVAGVKDHSGCGTLSQSAGGSADLTLPFPQTISFGKTFSTPPLVLASFAGQNADSASHEVVITEVNTTSFNVEVLSSGLSTVRISWVALDGLPSQGLAFRRNGFMCTERECYNADLLASQGYIERKWTHSMKVLTGHFPKIFLSTRKISGSTGTSTVNTVFATNAYALLWMTPVGAMPTSYSGFTMDVLLANHPLVDAGTDSSYNCAAGSRTNYAACPLAMAGAGNNVCASRTITTSISFARTFTQAPLVSVSLTAVEWATSFDFFVSAGSITATGFTLTMTANCMSQASDYK